MSSTLTDRSVPLLELVDSLTGAALDAPEPQSRPLEGATGAVAGIDTPEGGIEAASGVTARFDLDGSVLDPDSPEVTTVDRDTLFDLASVTKVVTTLTAASLIDDGVLDPHAPLAEHVPSPHPGITARDLLTHTSGLPPVMPIWTLPGDREHRLDAIRGATLDAEPGTAHAYSCLGFILLGTLLEQLTGTALPRLAQERVLDPAGARTARWAPVNEELGAVAATEQQSDPPRGLVRGQTHDETAWSLDGVGNAGVFATLADVLAIGRVLAGRSSALAFSGAVRTLLTTDQLPPGVTTGAGWSQGFGLRLGQEIGPGEVLAGPVGHPGFTGTSVLADPATGTVAVLLSNRVHPDRSWFTLDRARQDLARLAFA